MGRSRLIRSNQFPYHVTARTNNRVRFPVELKFVWEIATEELYLLNILYGIEIHAFVLMPNHFHLLITIPNEDLGIIMMNFLSMFTKKINRLSGQTGHLFGSSYYRTLITSTRYFGHAFKYVYRNPVKGGLVDKIEEYEFSTASGLFGQNSLPFPLHFTRIGLELNLPDPDLPNTWINWLNTPFPKEAEILIQKALRKKKVHELIDPKTRRPFKDLSQFL